MIRIGVSACLLGQKVRYDGGHKKEGLLTDLWSRHLTFVPVCPELEVGMGVPRPPIHLEKTKAGVRLVETKSGRDWTEEMEAFSVKRSKALESAGLSGFIFKKNSPSCGLWGVQVHEGKKAGRGAFAAVFRRMNPLLPVEEEGRLQDERLRNKFLTRVFALHRRKPPKELLVRSHV